LSQAEREAEAKRLLAEAGYGDGKPLTVTLKFGGQEKNRRTAVAIQAMWKKIGIDARLENIGTRSVVSDARQGTYEVMRYNYFAPYLDPVAFLNLLKTDSNTNYSRYSNPEFDELLTQVDSIRDPEARTAELRRLEAMAMADFPVIPVYFEGRISLISKRVKGWIDNGRGDHLARYMWLEDAP
jgi:oligopeptide transport system substrate-binding protein